MAPKPGHACAATNDGDGESDWPGPDPSWAQVLRGSLGREHNLRVYVGGVRVAHTLQRIRSMTLSTENQVAQPVEFTGCCPRFKPEQITEQEIVWKDKLFVAEHVMSIFHVPLNMVQRVKHASALIRVAGAAPLDRPLFLGEELSPWKSNIYLEATHYVPEANMVRLSGTFLPKVFEGPFRDAPKWMEAMQKYVAERGQKVERILVGYTTCPKCSKAYGENYVVLYAQLATLPAS